MFELKIVLSNQSDLSVPPCLRVGHFIVMNIIIRFENEISSVLKSLPDNTVFLAAVSGGADSMAMLTALYSLSRLPTPNFKFSVLHVEHGLRSEEESQGDAEFVRAFCKERGIDCRVKNIQPGRIAAFAKKKGIGIEAAARFFRHRAFCAEASRVCERADIRILTAHTKDDLLETTLMRALRGCGPAGLAGMKAKSEKRNAKNSAIVRPLIAFGREDVIAYLKAKVISWREDSTNAGARFLRNRIRNRLVPLLDEAFPSWRAGIDAMAETQSLAADFIANEAGKRVVWEKGTVERYSKDQTRSNIKNSQTSLPTPYLSTDEKNFFAQPPIIREEAIFQAVDELIRKVKNPRSVKRAVVRRFCALAESSVKAADFGVVAARLEGEKIYITRKRKEFFECGVSVLIREIH